MKRFPFYEVKRSLFQSARYDELVPGAKAGYDELFQQHPTTISRKPLFNSYLSFVLLEENIPATRYDDQGKTSGEFTIGREFWQSYVEGFTRGEKDFTLFATHNNKSDILEKYKSEWAYYETALPLLISHETVEKFGYHAGMIAGVKKLGLIKEGEAIDPALTQDMDAMVFAAFLYYKEGPEIIGGRGSGIILDKLKRETYPGMCNVINKTIIAKFGAWQSSHTRLAIRSWEDKVIYIRTIYERLRPILSDNLQFQQDYSEFAQAHTPTFNC